MSEVVVIGAGANGLAAAAYLGRAGHSVTVLEAREMVGGLASSVEFHPGYSSAGILADTEMVRPVLVRELDLERYGLELRGAPAPLFALGRGGDLDIHSPPPSLRDSLAGLRSFIDRVKPVLAGFCDDFPIDVINPESTALLELLRRGLALRRLGKRDMLELMRVAPMCLADWLREHLEDSAEGQLAAAALALPSLQATFSAPRSPGGCANFLLQQAMRGPGTAGGAHRFVAALERAALDVRVTVRTNARVSRIDVERRRTTGVTLETGEVIAADIVLACNHPRSALLELTHPRHSTVRLAERLAHFRSRGTTAHLLVAASRKTGLPARGIIGDSPDEIERAFDAVKYGELPARPVLEFAVASDEDPTLCPEGHEVLSALVHFVPTEPKGGWTNEARSELTARALARLAEHSETLDGSLVATRVFTPSDIEREYALPGGNIHHGERAIDQLLVRPVPECSQYATPIEGLFLGGGGSHPGGGLHGGCGRLAAEAIAKA